MQEELGSLCYCVVLLMLTRHKEALTLCHVLRSLLFLPLFFFILIVVWSHRVTTSVLHIFKSLLIEIWLFDIFDKGWSSLFLFGTRHWDRNFFFFLLFSYDRFIIFLFFYCGRNRISNNLRYRVSICSNNLWVRIGLSIFVGLVSWLNDIRLSFIIILLLLE